MDWIWFRLYFLILASFFASTFSNELGSPCTKDSKCKVENSHCFGGVCTCKHYHAPLGTTECLESKLLGRECLVSEQCSLRVANSTCRNGHCHCSQGFIRFRKHTCLGPAKPGDVCYSDEHCQLWSSNSHCKFLIPKLFGKCICDNEGNCTPSEAVNPPVTDFVTVENKTGSTEATTSAAESGNDGEVSHQVNENAPEESKESQKTSSQFVDPFQHQKEHLQDLPPQVSVTKRPETESVEVGVVTTGIPTESDVTKVSENSVTEEDVSQTEATALDSSTVSVNPDASTDGSKYRVEADTKDTPATAVNWDDVTAVSLGYSCLSDVECQKRDNQSRCLNGVCDCVANTNGTNVCDSQNTGCGPETFQCRESGICISWFFVCDGRNDCPDKSDEECHGPKCPKMSFQCEKSGTCVSLAVICDGVKNCPDGEDERLCIPDKRNSTQGCPDHTFQCANGQCLPRFEFCNAIPKCADGSDESPLYCSTQQSNKKAASARRRENCPFECGNGRCRSTAIVCSGRDGCGDNSDEAKCSVCRCPVEN